MRRPVSRAGSEGITLKKANNVSDPSPGSLDLSRFKKQPSSGERSSSPIAALGSQASGDVFSVVAKERRVQEILASIENLPSLPSVVMEVMQLANDERAKAEDFEEVIRKDQSLTARLLKLVNSPFFGMRTKVTSISQAHQSGSAPRSFPSE